MPYNRIESYSAQRTQHFSRGAQEAHRPTPQALTIALKEATSEDDVKSIWNRNRTQFNKIHYSAMWSSLAHKRARIETSADSELLQATRKQFKKCQARELSAIAHAISCIEVRGSVCREELTHCWEEIACSVSDKQGFKDFNPQDLAMLTNGLSKVEGKEVERALKSIAQELTHRDFKDFKPQGLAMLANGLSKVEGEEVESALKSIAQELPRQDFKDFKPQGLAMLSNGLSKVEGEEVESALKSIAQELPRQDFKDFKPQGLAMLANGLSKAEGKEVERALKSIAQELPRRDFKDKGFERQ